ncbi:MAG: insulinase family protein, partial [Gemmatimonadetes bacterium]|nr:insulinase family protein [Gemmatimonadota bacterium]
VLLPAAGRNDDPGREGIAYFTGELLDAGAAGRTGLEIAEELEGLGVMQDTGVSWDSTQVGFTALRSRLEPAVGILADLVRRPDFPAGEVDRVRAERLAAIAQRRANPGSLADEVTMRAVFAPGTPFARMLGGSPASVQGFTREDVAAFHARRYLPAGAAVIAAGDVTLDEVAGLVEASFGDWAGAPDATPPVEVRRRVGVPRVYVVDRPGSVQVALRVGQVGIPFGHEDYVPTVVMNHVLGGAFASRINLNLRERHGYTYGASSSFVARREPGPFLVSTAVETEFAAPALREIFREVEGIRDAPVAPEELDDTRSYLAGVFPLRLETTTGLAARLAQIAAYGLPDDYFDRYRERILEVTADDVLRAARAHLRPDEMVAVAVGDATQIRGALEEIGEVEVYDVAELEA